MEVNHNVFVHFSTHVGTYSWTLGSEWFVELNLAWLSMMVRGYSKPCYWLRPTWGDEGGKDIGDIGREGGGSARPPLYRPNPSPASILRVTH